MFNFLESPGLIAAGLILAAVQLVAALPWLWAVDRKAFASALGTPGGLAGVFGGLIAFGLAMAMFLGYKGESANLPWYGRYVYGAVLHLQLLIGLFLLMPHVLVSVWPKGGAVALAAYREGWRQPMFWFIIVAGIVVTWIAVVLPYFTFGDDFKMMKQIGFDVIMLAAILFGVLASSMSISEEIEGRTAVTLMSKPVNRRQFLIGKFLGILMACLALTLILGWNLNIALRVMPEFDKISEVVDPMPMQAAQELAPEFGKVVPTLPGKVIARAAGVWFADTFAHSMGLLLGFGQVMILVAIAAALATRVPFIVNIVVCMFIYFLGHLAPVIVRVAERTAASGDTAGIGLVGFLGKLFDALLPSLEFFNNGPAIIREAPLDLWQFGGYALTVFGYSLLYTGIALLVGLLLFEDRDLA